MQTQYNMNPLPVEGEMEFDNTALPQLTEMSQQSENRLWIENEGPSDAVQAPSTEFQCAEQTVLRKRKQVHSDDGVYGDNPAYCNLLHTERQKLAALPVSDRATADKYLAYPQVDKISHSPTQVMQLRSLFLGIGSCGALLDFEELFRVARQKKAIQPQYGRPILNIAEMFNEICLLESEEALCVLTRRYHVIKFCSTAREVFHQNNCMVMETSSTFTAGHRVRRGNPNVLREAAITTALATQIQPLWETESKDFKKLCFKVKRLRKLARNLQMLTDIYGFGILALLPSGPSHQDLSVTDTMSVPCVDLLVGLS